MAGEFDRARESGDPRSPGGMWPTGFPPVDSAEASERHFSAERSAAVDGAREDPKPISEMTPNEVHERRLADQAKLRDSLPPGTRVPIEEERPGLPWPTDLQPRSEFPDDPWRHRALGMRCSSCMWFVIKEDGNGVAPTLGRCRRRAPTMNGYPVVYQHDWCGDHKLTDRPNGG